MVNLCQAMRRGPSRARDGRREARAYKLAAATRRRMAAAQISIKLPCALCDYAEEAIAGEVRKIRTGVKVKLHVPGTAIRLRNDEVP